MKVSISSRVFTHFNPQFNLALLLITGIDNIAKLSDSLHVLHDVEQSIRLTFHKDTIQTHHLISPWNIITQKLVPGAKHYHTQVELLLKKVLARKSIKRKDTVGNLIQYVSLRHIVPISADDVDLLHGDLIFAISRGGKGKKGNLYYHDQKRVLGKKLDYWKSSKTAVSAKTTSALIHIEAIPPVSAGDLKNISLELGNLITGFCGGKVKRVILGRKKSWVKF